MGTFTEEDDRRLCEVVKYTIDSSKMSAQEANDYADRAQLEVFKDCEARQNMRDLAISAMGLE